jgi:LysM repeat protein
VDILTARRSGIVAGQSIRLAWLAILIALISLSFVPRSALAAEQTHTVERGDSLALIAQQYGVSLDMLMALNGISDPNTIYIGQQLLIPANPGMGEYGTPASRAPLPGDEGYYVVRRGDTLAQIAKRYELDLDDLLRLNDLTDTGDIYVGQRLRVTARVLPLPAGQEPQPQVAETIYVVGEGETLYDIARQHNTTPQMLMTANGLPNVNFVWPGQRLRIPGEEPVAQNLLIAAGAPADGKRWIEVNLSKQTLTAWQGDVAVMHTSISSGRDIFPTVTGRYTIQRKYEKQRMTGVDYDLPNVPWVMYFYSGYAIHGAYWHNKFGTPTSHGCVNMRIDEAEMIYHWADIGTEVYVHD